MIWHNGTIEKSAARTPRLTRAHKVYSALGWVRGAFVRIAKGQAPLEAGGGRAESHHP